MVGSGVLRTGLEAGARVVATSHAWLGAGPTQRALQTLVAPSTHKLRTLRFSSAAAVRGANQSIGPMQFRLSKLQGET